MAYDTKTIEEAKRFFGLGKTVEEIETLLGVSARTIRGWKKEGAWDSETGNDLLAKLYRKFDTLDAIETPTKEQVIQHEKIAARIESYELNLKKMEDKRKDTAAQKESQKAIKKGKNSFVGIDLSKLTKPRLRHQKPSAYKLKFMERPWFYKFQSRFLNDLAIVRFVLKSRQLGFSHALAWEALEDALITGKNKIFISASKKQVGQIRSYINDFSEKVFGVPLSGTDCITIINPQGDKVEFHFLSTNSATTQSYHGDLYFDEFCWIPKVQDLLDTALAMAIQEGYRITYVSTPSSKSHGSYNLWAGLDEKGESTDDEISRHEITLDQAIADGYDRITWEKIRKHLRYTERQIRFLFKCQWVEDGDSIFNRADLEACWFTETLADESGKPKKTSYVDLPKWAPTGYKVFAGFDPNGGGEDGNKKSDSASLALVEHRPGKVRLIDRHVWAKQSINWQVKQLQRAIKKYKINRLEIDTTGVGLQVYNILKPWTENRANVKWAFELVAVNYSLSSKALLAFHMERIVAGGEFEFNHSDTLAMQSFSAIKIGTTAKGGQPTIKADRSKGVGHADLFWAIAHACSQYQIENSPLKQRKKRTFSGTSKKRAS